MSAFIVELDLIDALLTFLTETATSNGTPISDDDLQEFGKCLIRENQRSVNYRYRETNTAPKYRFYRHEALPGPIAIAKACSCLDYQCCETPDWSETPAYRVLLRIHNLALLTAGYKPEDERAPWRATPDYERAPWGMVDNPGRTRALVEA